MSHAQKHLAQANRHIAELRVQIVRQRVIAKDALDTGQRSEMAESLLDALEGSLRASPSKKSMQRFKTKVGNLLVPGNHARSRGGMGQAEMTTTRTLFTFRVDTWTSDGESIVEHVAGIGDYQVALATYHAACERWPGTPITLRQGARVIEDSQCLRVV
jgi:hypothetical protein